MAKLKVGVVGCGKIANCNHIPGYKSCKNVEIVALCDIVPEKMAKTKEEHKLEKAALYNSITELLNSRTVDAISICTPNDLHYPMTMEALKAGVHVLCDKPMAFNTQECSEMIKTAEKYGKLLHINHSWHYMGISNTLRKLIADGNIGEFVGASCICQSTNPPHIAWSPGADWFVQAAHEGGIIQDIAVHLGELMQWISGQRVTEVAAYTDTRFPGIDVVDTFVGILRFANGASATMDLSWTGATGVFRIDFRGTEGVISMRDGKLYFMKKGAKKERELKIREFKQNSQQNFVKAINGKAEQITGGKVGREAIAICNAVTESGKSGKFVKVKEF